MQNTERRHDIDWLRVIAIAMLLIYHIARIFQPWGKYIGFIQSEETSNAIWIPMTMLNVWRIPLLFFVSGMGVCFSLRRRDWKKLLSERARRILLPLVFGALFIVPIHHFIFQKYYGEELAYEPSVGHLWFLLNICIYVTQVIGFAFLDQKYEYKFYNYLRSALKHPYLIYLFFIPFIIEAHFIDPQYFSLYVGTTHGFILGMLAFSVGFQFIAIGEAFWNAVEKMKFLSLAIAVVLYFVRLFYFEFAAPNYLASIESMSWIFALLGLGYAYLNKPSKLLSYLSQSAYPVYIIHMIFLYAAAYLILPMGYSLGINFILINVFTFASCFVVYDLIIKRTGFLRPLFGLKGKPKLVLEKAV
jgi:peptidoglycan/LPS O-acetylase OafA/YrhL